MRLLILAAAAALLSAPALAQTPPAAAAPPPPGAPPSDTVKVVLDKGLSIDMQGMPIDMAFAKDGTFSAAGGAFAGKYRVDGKKICMSADALPQEMCQEYPDGKKPGDSFELSAGDLGSATATINK